MHFDTIEINREIRALSNDLKMIEKGLDFFKKQERLKELNDILSNDQDLWQDHEKAIEITKEKDSCEKAVNLYLSLKDDLEYCTEIMPLVESDAEKEDFTEKLKCLSKKIANTKIQCMFKDPYDANDCFIDINSGAGGTEAQDWADMLANMYIKWSDKNNYKLSIIDRLNGEEAGIKSISMRISGGDHLYGTLKYETGVHRLVRISPFDSSARRHTSFASVWVYPETSDNIDIVVDDKDIRIDTYRASGAGGQHVNKTDSAVRITHIPTGIVIQCQNERSQHKNKSQAMKMLKAKLYQVEEQKKEDERTQQYSEKKEIGWGSQIRSYVLHPYKMVKDLRTQHEQGNPEDVLNGDINQFLYKSIEYNFTKDKN